MCSRGGKDITWWKMERFYRQLSSVFEFKSGRDWAGRRACLGRKQAMLLHRNNRYQDHSTYQRFDPLFLKRFDPHWTFII